MFNIYLAEMMINYLKTHTKLTSVIIFLSFLHYICYGSISSGNSSATRVPILVTSNWLLKRLDSSNLVILQISTIKKDYDNGHIPGAKFLWSGSLIVSTEKESIKTPSLKQMKKVLEKLGINNKSHIILCGIKGSIEHVCRIYVTLDHLGLADHVSILDGGFEDWKMAGNQVSVEQVNSDKSKLQIISRDNLVYADWVSRILRNSEYRIIDARSEQAYYGVAGAHRKGHIPGAANLDATSLFDSKTFKFIPVEKLSEKFKEMKISDSVRPVFYCFIGYLATVDYVAAKIAGFDPILFDGSMEEWASRLDLPIETGNRIGINSPHDLK